MNNDKLKLFCFPFGGAGVSIYNEWQNLFGEDVEIIPIQLPGRERLIDEEPFTDLNKAADHFAELIKNKYSESDVAFFGHCFLGSVLAFEVIKRLEKCANLNIKHLFVSSAFAPGSDRNYNLDMYNDDNFIKGVEKLTGFKNEAFLIPELRELLLPSFKADFKMDMNYKLDNIKTVNVPITVLYAKDDDFVDRKSAQLWAEYTTTDFSFYDISGEHLYLCNDPKQAIQIIKNIVKAEKR
ncbi:MAG: thioesterase [Clostridium sp.]|nr:thioesterase [Clostridium sp.]